MINEVLFGLLASVSFDSGASMQVPGSAQNQAYVWLAGNENLSTLSTERLIQRYALATLYFSTNGPSWSQTQGWLTQDDECSWFSTGGVGARCSNNVFTTLDLGFNGLSGSIPPEIGLLTGLTRIDLSGGVGPGVGGILPSDLSSLTALETLLLHDNAISGPLPPGIGAWSNLRILGLQNNGMTGILPVEIGDMGQLTYIDVSFNSFRGALPNSIGNLEQLQ